MMEQQDFGRVTLPAEEGCAERVGALARLMGADAIRNSDGTRLDEETLRLGLKVYSTYFVSRGKNHFAKDHKEERQHIYLLTPRYTAEKEILEIPLMEGFLSEQVSPDYDHSPAVFWEVRDRTEGRVIPPQEWQVQPEQGAVRLSRAEPYHEYTVAFLAWADWDPTQMYNYITNDWQDVEKDIPFDLRQSAAAAFAPAELSGWLEEHPEVDVVRFTTFLYHFTLLFSPRRKEKYVDWFGYGFAVSPEALEAFSAEYGYSLTPEDFVDEGYYNSPFRVPSRAFRDFMSFTERFVCAKARELVAITHQKGREAMMFLGDTWIGAEPYGREFPSIGLDAVVGSVGNGTTLRMLSEIRGVRYTEARFLPYFFPDVFREGGDPVREARECWLSARRAMMVKPVDRIGYGGYPSLAMQFPDFLKYMERVAKEFRKIYNSIHGCRPFAGLRVGIINSWGELRSWQTHMVAHAIPYAKTAPYTGILEALSGLPVEVSFLSLSRIAEEGIPQGVDVLLNAGEAGTAFSGGKEWEDPRLICRIRRFVREGGGLIGIGEPSAYPKNGRYFQLADLLGVEREMGFSLSENKPWHPVCTHHFITEELSGAPNLGEDVSFVYPLSEETEILCQSGESVRLAANCAGRGRGVYLSGLPFSTENTRLLHRALYWAAGKEKEFFRYLSKNPACEAFFYPQKKLFAVLNQTALPQKTVLLDGRGKETVLSLAPEEIYWGCMAE